MFTFRLTLTFCAIALGLAHVSNVVDAVKLKLKTKVFDAEECVICQDKVPNVLTLPCRHKVMCDSCASTWLCQKNQCPNCQTEVASKEVDIPDARRMTVYELTQFVMNKTYTPEQTVQA